LVITLRAGLSGAGPIGLGVIQNVGLHNACDVVAVHDNLPGAAKRLADGSSLGYSTESFEKLLAYGVDFVVLTGPLEDRLAQVKLACEQSVPCLVHAPVAPDLATAKEMTAICAAHEVRLGVYVRSQADPVVEQLRRMIAADWLGGVVCVQSIIGDDELLRTGSVTHSGDPFVTLASEHVHITTWLTSRQATSVTAQTMRSFAPDLDDGGVATVVLRGNIPCTYITSRLTRANAFAVHGTDGGVRIAGDRIWLTGQRPFQGHVFDYETPGIEQVLSRRDLQNALAAHRAGSELHGRFARWLEDMDDYPCPIEQAIIDFETIDAMTRAARDGRTIKLS
jgi:predicted dehydrogenase